MHSFYLVLFFSIVLGGISTFLTTNAFIIVYGWTLFLELIALGLLLGIWQIITYIRYEREMNLEMYVDQHRSEAYEASMRG